MKKNLCVCFGILFGLSATAQVTFNASSLPGQTGEYNRSYYSTNNLSVPAMLTLATNSSGPPGPGGSGTNSVSQTWDFSQPERTNETVLRTDIIAPADGPDNSYFPAAGYAEQDTMEPDSQIAWRYYSITNLGRYYYGFYDPPNQNADSLVQFDQPTIDVTNITTNGQTWTRTVTWNGNVLGLPIEYQFFATAMVDAYGALTLPGIGGVPALRVHEIHSYHASELISGGDPFPLDIHTNQYYYWLVPGLGVAVQVFEFGDNTLYPLGLTMTNLVERMFQASYFTNQPPSTTPPAGNLRIQVQNGSALLSWDAFTNSSSYRVQASGMVASTNWQSLGLTTNKSWSDTLTATQRFYRVVGLP